MTSSLVLCISSVAWLSSLFASSGRPATGPAQSSQPAGGAGAAAVYQLGSGLRAKVQGPDLVITDGSGASIAHNSGLIRLADARATCPSDGFERIVAKGDYFTIEQQTCGGWFFTTEYITFHYLKASRKIVLHKYGRVSTDRRAPNQAIPAEVYTATQLGEHSFGQTTKALLDAVGH
ncbi:MAG: hypothetical protein EOO62_37200 [Hymenobacter sp.]|nr:MAG: hypothetical protein EOO62_37200 [Hymenobacter sp.]